MIDPIDAVRPQWGAGGVPWCPEDPCPSYDGKRCTQTGFRPGPMCEPAVVAMAEAITGALPVLEKFQGGCILQEDSKLEMGCCRYCDLNIVYERMRSLALPAEGRGDET